MRHTGGSALGDTSTRSKLASAAKFKASAVGNTPIWSPCWSITRTSRLVISLLRLERFLLIVYLQKIKNKLLRA